MKKFKAYINGTFVSTENELEIISPLNNQVAGSIPALGKKHIQEAFEVAKATFSFWFKTDLNTRKVALEKFNKLLLSSKKELGKIITSETGKLLPEAIVEVERTVEYIDQTIKA